MRVNKVLSVCGSHVISDSGKCTLLQLQEGKDNKRTSFKKIVSRNYRMDKLKQEAEVTTSLLAEHKPLA